MNLDIKFIRAIARKNYDRRYQHWFKRYKKIIYKNIKSEAHKGHFHVELVNTVSLGRIRADAVKAVLIEYRDAGYTINTIINGVNYNATDLFNLKINKCKEDELIVKISWSERKN